LGCEHPGKCIEIAKDLIDSITAKWNPVIPNPDLCEELSLTDEELEQNKMPIETDQVMTFNPNFRLSEMESGFRIFCI
jgi:hypothetical protein